MAKKLQGHDAHMQTKAEATALEEISRPLKVAFLGAGSGFMDRIFVDILNLPGAQRGEFRIVDVDARRLALAERLCHKIVELMGVKWTVKASTDRRKVLRGADYVVNSIEVSGVDCVRYDNDIPLKYGIDQCIGDTVGPGGLFKALRTVPVFLEILKDIEKYCPNAYVLNYTNPMSILCQAASVAGFKKIVGLCHSVQGTSKQLAKMADVPYEEMTYRCGGINHLAWFTELSHRGRDLYPRIFDVARTRKDNNEGVRLDMMLHFGLFVTESSGHFSEYLPYYRKRAELVKRYCGEKYSGGSGFYAREWVQWRAARDKKRDDQLAGKLDIKLDRGHEYASSIIHSLETGQPSVAYCTVPNSGLIPNLSQHNVCEVACLVNRGGIQPTYFGELPPQCAAICESNLRMIELAAIACVEKSREAAIHSLMLDPLTAAVCCPAEIRQMTEELFKAERKFIHEGFYEK